MKEQRPVILAISAASGIIFGIRILKQLLESNFSTELIISRNAYYIAKQELNIELEHDANKIKKNILNFIQLEDKQHLLTIWLDDELWANPASGSYLTSCMIVSPASMSCVARISSGIAEDLIARAADVHIKEGRKLVIVPRETPLSSIHLKNLLRLSEYGVRIIPPVAGFYTKMETLDDYIGFVSGKVLDSVNVEHDLFKRWQNE